MMLERSRKTPRTAPADAPARKAVRTSAPILLRFVGCADEPLAVNGEFFTLGDGADDTVALPAAMRRAGSTKLRFTRGAEGWRVAAADGRLFIVNQRACRGPTVVESGDVVRLEPGGAGVQFLVRSQPDAALAEKSAKAVSTQVTDAAEATPPMAQKFWLRSLLVVAAVIAALAAAYWAGVATAPPVVESPAIGNN